VSNPNPRELLLVDDDEFSPLLLITREPVINDFLARLGAARRDIIDGSDERYVLRFSRAEIARVQQAFARVIRRGEATLHRLCELFSDSLLDGDVALQSVVIGEVEATGQRFKLSEAIRPEDLYVQTDLQLGTRQLDRLQIETRQGLSRARLISNSVEYQPLEKNRFSVHKMISRIKAEEELWNKVCDELFHLDQVVRRDKELRRLGRFVKDVFGIKIIVEEPNAAWELLDFIKQLEWSDEELAHRGIEPASDEVRSLRIVELKDYLSDRKKSGWGALKAVLQWAGKTFELQIQTANAYHRELLYLTRESHAGHKQRREALRRKVGEQIPLFAFYIDLLQWLFVEEEGAPPEHENIEVILED
jgi:ppGpp synthetase/RelA/SpoT-type nucleotidyltranferase